MNIKNIKNTLKTMGLFSLTLNLNAENAKLNLSHILVKGEKITEIENTNKILETQIKDYKDETAKPENKDKKIDFKATVEIEKKDEKDEKKTKKEIYEITSLEDAEKITKEVNEKIKYINADDKSDEKKLMKASNFNPLDFTYTNPVKNEKGEYDTEINKTKTGITLGYVLILAAAGYFGYNYATQTNSDVTVEAA